MIIIPIFNYLYLKTILQTYRIQSNFTIFPSYENIVTFNKHILTLQIMSGAQITET